MSKLDKVLCLSFFLRDQNEIYYYQHIIFLAQDVPEKKAKIYNNCSIVTNKH